MNRSAELLAALALTPDEFVSRAEIYRRIGAYAILNNAASEARKQGHDVRHELVDGVHGYRLVLGAGAQSSLLSTTPHVDEAAPCAEDEACPDPPSPLPGQLVLA